jgi:tRNA methyl transferase
VGLQVCEQAGVELKVVPLTEQYWDRVVAHSISEIRAGRTPNPDILCNARWDTVLFLLIEKHILTTLPIHPIYLNAGCEKGRHLLVLCRGPSSLGLPLCEEQVAHDECHRKVVLLCRTLRKMSEKDMERKEWGTGVV